MNVQRLILEIGSDLNVLISDRTKFSSVVKINKSRIELRRVEDVI